MNRWKAAALAVVAAGVAMRVAGLAHLPGINGDEAWYGVNVNELIAGRPAFLQTPSGNVVNPVHSLPILFLSLVAEPSFVLLRVPEVCYGILAVLLAYPLLARPLGARAAALCAVVLAAAPTAVMHSRFGWDPSGTQLPSLLAVALALRDWPVLAAASVAIAYVVHPTNVFLAPTVLALWLPHGWRRYRTAAPRTRARLRAGGLAAAVACVPVGFLLALSMARMGRLPSIEMVAERAWTPSAWIDSALSIVRMLSGVTAASYLAGPIAPALAWIADGVAAAVLALAFATAIRAARRGHWTPGVWLAAGLAASFVAFHLVAGPIALEPGFERYAMPFLVPLVIAGALAIDALAGARPGGSFGGVAALVCAALLSVSTLLLGAGYFYPLVAWGGAAHATFRTGPVEPKAAAYAFIRADSRAAGVVSVYAEDWWIYWPIRYLAIPDAGRVFVEMIGQTPPIYPEGAAPPPYPAAPDKVYAVVFDGGGPWMQIKDQAPVLFTARDPRGRPILHVLALAPDAPVPFADESPWQGRSK